MQFVAGALYFWAPEYVNDVLGVSVVQADLGIGILTVFCGLVGTAGGGYLVDQLGGGDLIAATVCFVFSLLCFPLAFVAFLVDNVIAFFVLMALAELLIFAITSPINTLCLRYDTTQSLDLRMWGNRLSDCGSGVVWWKQRIALFRLPCRSSSFTFWETFLVHLLLGYVRTAGDQLLERACIILTRGDGNRPLRIIQGVCARPWYSVVCGCCMAYFSLAWLFL